MKTNIKEIYGNAFYEQIFQAVDKFCLTKGMKKSHLNEG